MTSTLDLLRRLGESWEITLTCLKGEDQWQLRLQSHPSPHWNESFSYTYRGTLTSVIARAHAGEPDDGPVKAAS